MLASNVFWDQMEKEIHLEVGMVRRLSFQAIMLAIKNNDSETIFLELFKLNELMGCAQRYAEEIVTEFPKAQKIIDILNSPDYISVEEYIVQRVMES
jgi:hypothetical protein